MVQKNCVAPYNSIIILGPTACGKTAVAIDVAKQVNGEIISADSMQFYKHLDIGTAKATLEEQNLVKHHCIDFLELTQSFNVAQYRVMVETICKSLFHDKKVPIIVGGSGFYVKTLLDTSFEKIDMNYASKKEEIEEWIKNNYQEDEWYSLLKERDCKTCDKVHPNNKKRILSYLVKSFMKESKKEFELYTSDTFLNPLVIVLCPDRQVIYDRINKRVDKMVISGLLDEAQMLLTMNLPVDSQCLAAIGYKELFPYLKGEQLLDQCIITLKQKTRNYAKRQITWLKHQVDTAVWIKSVNRDAVVQLIVKEFLENNL